MSDKLKIIVMGDTHGRWASLNPVLILKRPDIVLQCGDFGWWPHWSQFDIAKIQNGSTKIYWASGNHENWHDLGKLDERPAPCEVAPNIFYMKRGSVLDLPDGRKVLFIGGADSIDKDLRTPGFDWFPEETIKARDVENLPDERIDIVVSHTCPAEFLPELQARRLNGGWWEGKPQDPSCHALSVVYEKYRPKRWFFGHFHVNVRGCFEDTEWVCLNNEDRRGWWIWLDFDQ